MKKRILALAAALTLIFSLTACGNTTSSNNNSSTPPANTTAPESQPADSTNDNTPAMEPGLAGTVDNPYIITMGCTGTVTDPSHPNIVSMNAMNDKLMELSGGTMGFEIVFGGVYGSTAQHLAQIKAGTLDGMLTGFDVATNLENSDRFYAAAMPFVFDGNDHIDKFLASDLWADMVEDLAADNGIRIATLFFHQPPRTLETTKPITHPSEMAGVKLRVPETDVQVKVWTAAGASPLQVSPSELYSALDTGIADGQENDVTNSVKQKYYEVAPYFTNIEYIRQAQFLYTSEITWNKMNEQEKAWFMEAAQAAIAAGDAAYDIIYDESVQEILDNGGSFVEFDYEEWKQFFTDIVVNELDGVLFPSGLYAEIQAMA